MIYFCLTNNSNIKLFDYLIFTPKLSSNKILLLVLELTRYPSIFIGHGMGGVVATGFAAKFPSLVASIALISPMGVKFSYAPKEKLLKKRYFGEYLMLKRKLMIPGWEEDHFYQRGDNVPHRTLIDKQINMVKWQIDNTPGYLGAILSVYRYFPIRGMEELYTAIGRHARPVLVIWGDHDTICPYRKSMVKMEKCFPNGCLIDTRDCGHNPVAEKFKETVAELLSFAKESSDILRA